MLRVGRFLGYLGISVLVGLCFWLRCLGVGSWFPLSQLTEHDAYLYQHQAEIVSESGGLPARDDRRWVPVGRDTTQSLNLYPIVLGHLHRLLRVVFPEVSVYEVVFFAPVVCFSLALLCVSLFLARTHGFLFSVMVGLIVATLPGTIERSTAGFGDRDAFCFLIGVSAVVTYLRSLSRDVYRQRVLWTLVSGVLVFIGGLSWEGFGVFVSIVLCVEVWRFLSIERESGLFFYGLWVLCFVPALYLCSAAYRSGVGWSTHLFSFMLLPPVGVLALRGFRYWLLEKSSVGEPLRPYRHRMSHVLILFSVLIGVGYVVSIKSNFAATTVVFGTGPLMESITELVAPHFGYWVYRYGSVFLTGSLGLSLLPVFRWGRLGQHLSLSLFCFCVFVFLRVPVAGVLGAAMGDALFFLSGVGVCLSFGHLCWKVAPGSGVSEGEGFWVSTDIAMLFWSVFWFALARDAKRYDFFIGLSLAYFTSVLIQAVATWILNVLKNPTYTTGVVHAGLKRYGITPASVSVVVFVGVCLWGPMGGGHVFRSVAAAKHSRRAVPGVGAIADAYTWMRIHLPETAVVAAEWSYGTQLNVLGGVRTIVGPDHYLPYWIELYHQHVERAKNEHDLLTFLFTHDVTHVMVTREKQPSDAILGSGQLSGAFRPVYPRVSFAGAPVKVYELRYPEGLEKRPEHLWRMPLPAPQPSGHPHVH